MGADASFTALLCSTGVKLQQKTDEIKIRPMDAESRRIRREEVKEELRAFSKTYAGTAWDLDPELEKAGIEHLLKVAE